MANNVQNVITFQNGLGKIWETLRKGKLENDESIFSLSWLIPEPERKEDCPTKFVANEKSGIVYAPEKPWFNWYDWRRHFWGTKWDCYEVEMRCDELRFWTAWSTPLPIYEALAEKFPKEPFTVKFADEDMGYNCGIIRYNGDGKELEVTSMSEHDIDKDEAFKFACEVWDLNYEDEIAWQQEQAALEGGNNDTN